jgi:2-polyprenyl-3-methyl-5-hydroxy-6-metoxy-1,4-benzoquinol methylase
LTSVFFSSILWLAIALSNWIRAGTISCIPVIVLFDNVFTGGVSSCRSQDHRLDARVRDGRSHLLGGHHERAWSKYNSQAPGGGQEHYVDSDATGATAMCAARGAGTHAAFFIPYLRPGMRLLDCGCGPGSITCDLAKMVAPAEVVGIDFDPQRVEAATGYSSEKGVTNVRFQAATVYELPFPDASFDAVFAHGLLDHLAEPLKAVREMRRVLRPGGLIGVRAPDFDGHIVGPTGSPVAEVLSLTKQAEIHDGQSHCVGWDLRGFLHQVGCTRVIATDSYE